MMFCEVCGVAEKLFGGRDRGRTGDLIVANDALSQLSYSPTSSRCNFSRRLRHFQPRQATKDNCECWWSLKLRLIATVAGALRYDLSGILIERTRLGNGLHRFLNLGVGL